MLKLLAGYRGPMQEMEEKQVEDKADFLTDSLMLSVFSLRFRAGTAQQLVLRTVFCFLFFMSSAMVRVRIRSKYPNA